MRRRVVVTGIGVLSPLGLSADAHFDALAAGACGIAPLAAFDPGAFPVKYCAEIKGFRGASFLKNRKSAKVMARDIQLAVAAASLAARDARIYDGAPRPERFGVSMGAGLLCSELDDLGAAIAAGTSEAGFDLARFGRDGLANLAPLWLLKYLPNMVNSHISIEYDAQGPDNCITCGNASGLMAIGEAARVIERGDADIMIAGGAESKIHPMSFVKLHILGKLSTAGDLAARGPRPFGDDRSGMVIGEAAAVLVLEAEEHAKARGAKVYAEMAGFASSCGGQLVEEISSDGRAARESMAKSLCDAGCAAPEIDAVFADASGVPEDAAEADAILRVFDAPKPVFAGRAACGHTMAASGALDAATACLALAGGVLPGTFGATGSEELHVELSGATREGSFKAFLVNAFTFGGQTASAVFRKVSRAG